MAKDDLKLIIFCLSLLSSKMMGTRYKPPRKVVCVLVCVHIHLYMTMYGGQWLMTGSTLILRQALNIELTDSSQRLASGPQGYGCPVNHGVYLSRDRLLAYAIYSTIFCINC